MKIQYCKWLLAAALSMATLSGCGGGGSSAPAQGNTAIKGTASKGIIYPGTINVYAVAANGAKSSLLAGPIATDVDGKYAVSLGSYNGAILVEASGTYTDEATMQPVTIAATKPLHALIDTVDSATNNNRVVAVTALTELAWRKASANGANPTPPATILSANKLVNDLFKVGDIIAIEPVRPDNATMANANQEKQAYTLALASLSQLASTAAGSTAAAKLETVLTSMAGEIESAANSGSMNPAVVAAFTSALNVVALSADFPSARDQVACMGKKSQLVTIATSGTLPAGTKIFNIQGVLALPFDAVANKLKVLIRSDESNGQIMPEVLLLTGAAATAGGQYSASFLPLQHELSFNILITPSGTGIGIGDVATIAYDVASGATVSSGDFTLVNGSVSIMDINGVEIPGVTLIVK